MARLLIGTKGYRLIYFYMVEGKRPIQTPNIKKKFHMNDEYTLIRTLKDI